MNPNDCHEKEHLWIRLAGIDQCQYCGMTLQRSRSEQAARQDAQVNTAELAADLQALRTELREEVTS